MWIFDRQALPSFLALGLHQLTLELDLLNLMRGAKAALPVGRITHAPAAGVMALVELTPLHVQLSGRCLIPIDQSTTLAGVAHLWPLTSVVVQCGQLLGSLVRMAGADRALECLDLLQLLLLLNRSVVACRDRTEEDPVARHAARGLWHIRRYIVALLLSLV